jgi:glycerol uptake facilitator-like aquaporin
MFFSRWWLIIFTALAVALALLSGEINTHSTWSFVVRVAGVGAVLAVFVPAGIAFINTNPNENKPDNLLFLENWGQFFFIAILLAIDVDRFASGDTVTGIFLGILVAFSITLTLMSWKQLHKKQSGQ